MNLSTRHKRQVEELAHYVTRLAPPRGGYIFIGVSDDAIRKQVQKALNDRLPAKLRFESEPDLLKRDETYSQTLQNLQSKYEIALELLQQRLEVEQETVEVADLMLRAAEAAHEAGRYREAQDWAEKALAIYRKLEIEESISRVLTRLANISSDFGNPQIALNYLLEALETNSRLGDRNGKAASLGNIGLVYSTLRDPHKALQCYSQALEIYRELGNISEVARQLGNMARWPVKKGIYRRRLRMSPKRWRSQGSNNTKVYMSRLQKC